MAASDANFFYNSMLAKALVQLLPANEKPPLRQWFSRLLFMDKDPKQIEIRDEYMWFMLMMLQCQKIREPFNHTPPAEITLLRDIVDPKIYEEILIANGDNMTWMNKSNLETSQEEESFKRYQATSPAKFFSSQPVPHEGILCYMAAFSDQGYP